MATTRKDRVDRTLFLTHLLPLVEAAAAITQEPVWTGVLEAVPDAMETGLLAVIRNPGRAMPEVTHRDRRGLLAQAEVELAK